MSKFRTTRSFADEAGNTHTEPESEATEEKQQRSVDEIVVDLNYTTEGLLKVERARNDLFIHSCRYGINWSVTVEKWIEDQLDLLVRQKQQLIQELKNRK